LEGINGWSRMPQIRNVSRDRAYTFPVTSSGVLLAQGSVAFIITLACKPRVKECPFMKELDKPLLTD
jgi:hypothetical protein